jgi:predicted ATPase
VFPVPGLSIEADDGGPGDAVELFLDRAAATGTPLPYDDWQRVAVVCRGLDGMALAVELAAARVPSLGLDGLEAGLVDRLHLLTGGRRIDDRHRSLRSALHWSYALLDERERTVLRRISVFAAPFTADAASALAGWPPVAPATVPTILAGLADQSLLVAAAEPHGTRYRALETIRQYGSDRLEEAGESVEGYVRQSHGACPPPTPARRRPSTIRAPGGRHSTRLPTSCALPYGGRPATPGRSTSTSHWPRPSESAA